MNYKFEDLRRFSDIWDSAKKIQKRINKLDCDRCNGTIKEDVYDKNVSAELSKVVAIFGNFGIVPFHQSDPRGCSLYLIPSDWKCDIEYTNGIACC